MRFLLIFTVCSRKLPSMGREGPAIDCRLVPTGWEVTQFTELYRADSVWSWVADSEP
jgi:hypothetical protein